MHAHSQLVSVNQPASGVNLGEQVTPTPDASVNVLGGESSKNDHDNLVLTAPFTQWCNITDCGTNAIQAIADTKDLTSLNIC